MPGLAAIGDDLALAHMRARMQARREARQMAISGRVAVAVIEQHEIAVTAGPPAELTVPAPAAITGVPDRHGEIDALVHARVAQHRMEAHAEAR